MKNLISNIVNLFKPNKSRPISDVLRRKILLYLIAECVLIVSFIIMVLFIIQNIIK